MQNLLYQRKVVAAVTSLSKHPPSTILQLKLGSLLFSYLMCDKHNSYICGSPGRPAIIGLNTMLAVCRRISMM